MFCPIITRDGDGRTDLEQLCSHLAPNTAMLEVGSYSGMSASIFLDSGKVSTLYCVDAWKGDYDGDDICSFTCPMMVVEKQFDKRMDVYRNRGLNVVKVKKPSLDAVNMFPDEAFDMIYIDACHQYEDVLNDLRAWMPKVKKGGWIAGHDYGCGQFPGVAKAINQVIGVPQLLFCSGSWMNARIQLPCLSSTTSKTEGLEL